LLELPFISEQKVNKARAKIASPPGRCRVAEKRHILVALERIRLREPQFEYKGHEAEDEERRQQDGAGEDGKQEALLLRDHLNVGLSPLLGDGLILGIGHNGLLRGIGKELLQLLFLLFEFQGGPNLNALSLSALFLVWVV
jgi:hypothetical protein